MKAEGYMDKTSNYGASTTDTRNTIYLDKVVIFTVNVVDQYGGRIQGAKVTFNGETQTTESDGSATFTTSRGTYSYTVTYKGNTTEGTIIINQSDESVNVDFEKAIEDYRPTPNGNIQMLVKRNSLGTVHLQINSTTTEYVIDWGDGTTSEASGTGNKTYSHNYSSHIPYNVEISNCGNVTGCNVNVEYNYTQCLLAYWTIGNSSVQNLYFHRNNFAHNKLEVIGNDLFKNDNDITDFGSCFKGCNSLTSIPTGLFDNCTAVTDFISCFSGCSSLTSIPTGLFDNCTAVTSFSSCFSYCISITRADVPTFEKITNTSSWNRAFESCKNLAVVVAPQATPQPISSSTFNSSGTSVTGGFKIYVPDGSVDNYKTATNWSQYADRIYPMSELPE